MEILGINIIKDMGSVFVRDQARKTAAPRTAVAVITESAVEATEAAPGREDLDKAMEQLRQTFGVQVQLDTDSETGRDVVKILSSDGQRIIRQIPAEAALEMAHKAREHHLEGLLDSLA